jgi:O-antigen ligase
MTIANKAAFFIACLTLVFTTLAYGAVHQPIIAVYFLLVCLLLLLWTADGWISGKLKIGRTPFLLLLISLAVYGVVQMVPFGTYTDSTGLSQVPRTISLAPFDTLETTMRIVGAAIFFFVGSSTLNSAARLRRLATVLLIFGFAYGFFAILQSVLSPTRIYGIYGGEFSTPFGSFVNRHDFAAMMEMLVAVPLGLLFTGAVRPDKRLLYIIGVVLMASSLLLSGSRGGLVAFIAEVLFIAILTTSYKGTKNTLLRIGLSAALLIAAVAGAIFVGGDTSLTRFAKTASSDDITSSRTHIWRVTLDIIKDNLPFGTGLGAFGQAYTQHDTQSGMALVEQAHNDYLQLLSDAGLVGAVIGAAFLFWFFRSGFRNSKRENTFRRGIAIGAFAGCFAVLVHSIFDFVLHITAISLVFLTLLATLEAAGQQYGDDTAEFDQPRRSGKGRASVSSFRRS